MYSAVKRKDLGEEDVREKLKHAARNLGSLGSEWRPVAQASGAKVAGHSAPRPGQLAYEFPTGKPPPPQMQSGG